MKSNISEQTKYLQSKFTIIHPQNYKMSPLHGATLVGLAKKYPKNGGVRKANSTQPDRVEAQMLSIRAPLTATLVLCGDKPST